jgi:hypothetical protein
MKLPRLAFLVLFFICSLSYNRVTCAQDAPPQKPSPDNPQPPVPQSPPAPDTPAQQQQQPQEPAQPQQPAPDSNPQQQPAQPQQQPSPDSSSQTPQAPVREQALPNPPPLERGEKYHAPWEGEERWGRFSRVGIGADVSLLGVGIKGATILTDKIDVRLMGNFFNFNSSSFEIQGTRVSGTIHLASLQTAVDWYPRNSIWRLSAGALLWSGNQISASGMQAPGSSFSLNGKNYYSSKTDPLMASGVLGFHTHQPAFTLAGGFGRYVPRSARHWSFPSEYGVIFMGAPTLNITPTGTVCTSAAQTPATCSDVGTTSNPVGAEFNESLDAAEARWRRSLGRVTIYPIFSYGVVYSFTVRNK